jgi:hypothetical protein
VNTNAQAIAQKWVSRTSGASTDYVNGAKATDKDPTQLAINAAARWFQKTQEAYQQGKFQQGLARAGKNGWLAGIVNKGAANFSTGVQAAESKVAAAFGPLLQFEANLQQQVQQMPNVTDADKDARALAWIRGMRNYQAPA